MQFVGTVNIEIMNINLFIREFSSLMDRKRVLIDGPWNMFKNMLLFMAMDQGVIDSRYGI